MAKFYCQSGLFQTILDAPDCDVAARKAIRRLVQSRSSYAWVLTMNEHGFCHGEDLIYPIIPLLRAEGAPLLPDDILVTKICASFNILNLSKIDRHWFLYGDIPAS